MFRRPSAHGGLPWRVERPDGGSAGGSYPIPRPGSEIWQERPQVEAAEELIEVVRTYLK